MSRRAIRRSATPQPAGTTVTHRILRSEHMIAAALSVAVWLVYSHTLGFPLINLDDDVYVLNTPIVRQGLSWPGILWAFKEHSLFYWHPLTWISHMLDVQLYGINPFGHRVTNILLHTANVLLVFVVMRRLTGMMWPSAFVAGFFGLHPLRVESVVWIAERKDLLCAFCWLLTIWAYASYAERRFSFARYSLVLAGMAGALMSKPMAVTLPFSLLLLDIWPLKRIHPLMPRVLEKLPLLALSVFSSILTILGTSDALTALPGLTLALKLKTAVIGYFSYIHATVWPHPLSILYPYDRNPSGIAVAIAVFLLMTLTALAVRERRRRTYLAVGWFWFLGTLVPISGIVQAGMQSHGDRFTYLPHVGLIWAVVWLVHEIVNTKTAIVTGVTLLLAFAVVSSSRANDWRDPVVLFLQGIQATRNNILLEQSLGQTLLQRGKPADAEPHLREVVRINPNSLEGRTLLGNSLAVRGQFQEAADQFAKAATQHRQSGRAHFGLAMSLMNLGRRADARLSFERSLRLELEQGEAALAELNLGTFAADDGDLPLAVTHFESAITLNPASVNAHRNLAITLARLGRKGEALARLDRGLALTQQDATLAGLRSNLSSASR